MDKVLIIGGNSMIGKALADKWSNQNFEVHSTSRRFLNSNQIFFDLQSPNFSVFSDQYECIVFLAGDTNIQSCINNPILSEKVNVINTILALDFLKVFLQILFLFQLLMFSLAQHLAKVSTRLPNQKIYMVTRKLWSRDTL